MPDFRSLPASGPLSRPAFDPLSRRAFGRLALAGGAALGLRPGPAHAATPAPLTFDVFRKGDKIGQHRVTFEPAGDGFTARTVISLAVKVAFVVVYRYEQEVVDSWQGGKLVRSQAKTNDDGKETAVTVAQQGDRLVGTGPRGPLDLPLGTIDDISWWNIAITTRNELLDAQNGRINKLAVTGPIDETVEVAGRQVQARRFDVATTNQNGSIWYDRSDRWVKTSFTTKGELLDYRLVA